MIEPIAAMYAAVESVKNGGSEEIELEWYDVSPDGYEHQLRITVRKHPLFSYPFGGVDE